MQPMLQLVVNSYDWAVSCAREAAAGIFGSLDAKRPRAWDQYGYKQYLSFDDYLMAYERGGAGHGAVHRILDKCWTERPRIKQPAADKETPWETKLSQMLDGINAWPKLRDFDRRNMVGRYAGLLYRVADGQAMSQPLLRGTKLVDLVPVYENQLRVSTWDTNKDSPTYGQPAMWEYRSRPANATDTQGRPVDWVNVHPSRLQLLAEGSVGDFLDGVPLLKAGFNHLVDLEKIAGAAGEGFLKNSARTLAFKFDPQANLQVLTQNPDGSASTKSVKDVIEEQTQRLNRNIDASVVTQGGEATTLKTEVADPKSSFEVIANLFAASVQIPFTILFGQQTGRMASDEDKADMVARCKSRQLNELTPMLRELVTRLQAAGLVDAGEFEVEWPPLDAPGDDAKAGILGKLTKAMKEAFESGLTEPLFDANELRKVVSFEQRKDDGMPEEGEDPLDEGDPRGTPSTGPRPAQVTALRA
jgi:uncharacterized protein